MLGVQDFVKDSLPAMIDYIAVVSTPTLEAPTIGFGADERTRHDRLSVVNTLRQRTKKMPLLDRESIPILPHLIDVPKHLAIITSAVIRNSRELNPSPTSKREPTPTYVEEFCSKCFLVEEDALSRVSHLATRLASETRRPSLQDISANPLDEPPTSPRGTVTSTVVSANRQARRRKISRPSTAPSPTAAESSRRPPHFGENVTSPRSATRDLQPQRPTNNGHAKAPSTDSVPKLVREVAPPVRMPPPIEPMEKTEDDTGKRKRGLLRGILRR